ncbi:MAG: Peptidoglycan-binding lysin domain protein, partial [Conexibacter sp.]|nr:Peptidoglycan-binding lysin domain protein [Conexibacter sp.]
YHIAHWNELGVEYVIWQQKILTSPTGSWKQMENRGSATANHMDHVHVNYAA